jgi:hypothetical protein
MLRASRSLRILLLEGFLLLCLAPGLPGQVARLPVELPADLEPTVVRLLSDLDSPDWRRRERATSRLIELSPLWRSRIPVGWSPPSAEGEWRWQRVNRLVAQLTALPELLRGGPDATREGRLLHLRRETGAAFLDALEVCLKHPDTRVRGRAVSELAETRSGAARLRARAPRDDRSARVREGLFDAARRIDRDWALELVVEALREEESSALLAVAARAARGLGDPRVLPSLRARFRGCEDPHPEILLALAAFARPEDSAALDLLLGSAEYRQVSSGLDALGNSRVREHLPAVLELLGSEHWDIRVRALRRLEEAIPERLPYELLPLLEHEDISIYSFAVESLSRIGGEDFLGDIDASLRRWSLAERPFLISVEEGRVHPRPVPALGSWGAEPVREILRLRGERAGEGRPERP